MAAATTYLFFLFWLRKPISCSVYIITIVVVVVVVAAAAVVVSFQITPSNARFLCYNEASFLLYLNGLATAIST